MRTPNTELALIQRNFPDFTHLMVNYFGYVMNAEESSIAKTWVFTKTIGKTFIRVRFDSDFESLLISGHKSFELCVDLRDFVVDTATDTLDMLCQIDKLLEDTLVIVANKNSVDSFKIGSVNNWPAYALN